MARRGDELDDQQVGPHVHLVGGRGLDVLDRPRLDDGQQALGVTLRARGHRAPAAVATAVAAAAAARRRRRRRRRRCRRRRCGPAGGRGSCSPSSAAAAVAASPPARRRPPPARRGGRRRSGGPALGGPLAAGVRGPQPWAASRHGRLASEPHSGPEMPPSLRTRQKWMAMKMTMTNGNISTWSTYHRSSVSVPISTPAEQHEPHLGPEDGRVAHHVRAHRDRPEGQLVPRAAGSR